MLFLLAFVCPPLAILLCGRPWLALVSIPLWLPLFFPGILLALLVVASRETFEDHVIRIALEAAERDFATTMKTIDRAIDLGEQELKLKERKLKLKEKKLRMAERERRQASSKAPDSPVSPRKPISKPSPLLIDDLSPPNGKASPGFRETLADLRAAAVRARDGAALGYRNLPEWAQPITWGLAVATPIAVAMFVLWLSRR